MVVHANGGLEVRALREALATLGERLGLGLVVASTAGAVVFATERAERLLALRNGALPSELQRCVDGVAREKDESPGARVKLAGSRHTVRARATRLAGTRHVLLTLEEEGPRRDLSQGLVERFGLTARSVQLVQLASRGLTNREIGERLTLSEATVKTYMHALFRELGVRNRAELVALAERTAKGD
ncbi:MAG: response regulator transcription factor [Labilithrix sp.]|nr:response regulator transcription factor [Labilithrix sp.]